jgi:hypothetical protein
MRLVKDLKQENLHVLDYEDKGMNIYTISSFSLGNFKGGTISMMPMVMLLLAVTVTNHHKPMLMMVIIVWLSLIIKA